MLRAFLAEHDEPCPACGYNLRGLTGEACPECGEALRLRVGMVEPRMGLFLTGLLGLAFGTGFHAIVGLWALSILLNGGSGPEAFEFAVLVVGAVVCGSGLLIWLVSRRRIRHATPAVRVCCIASCWLVPAITVSWFLAVVT